jgi:hypothetical protein
MQRLIQPRRCNEEINAPANSLGSDGSNESSVDVPLANPQRLEMAFVQPANSSKNRSLSVQQKPTAPSSSSSEVALAAQKKKARPKSTCRSLQYAKSCYMIYF